MNDVRYRNSLMKWVSAVLGVSFAWSGLAALVTDLGLNFTGSVYGTDSYSRPADGNGVIGPRHFVEFINGRFSVYSKTNAARVQTMTDLAFWNGAGVTFASGVEISDPRLIYDRATHRWFAAMVDFLRSDESHNRFLLAVSATDDPTGTWQGEGFLVDPVNGDFGDFPTLGLDANGVYLAAQIFSGVTGNPIGNTLVAIPKADLLANPPIFTNRTSFGTMSTTSRGDILQPVVNFDPSATKGCVLAVGDLGYDFQPHSNLVAFAVLDAANPGSAALDGSAFLAIPSYEVPINPPQPDGSSNLDDGDARLGATVSQVADVLYAVHSIQAGARASIRWYRVRASDCALLESGTITHTNLDLFYPSIAANGQGAVVIGCNGSSATSFVSSYVLIGETVNGSTTFGDPILLRSGTASYQAPSFGVSRWGDYSATSVDPNDPTRFWTLQMVPTGTTQWSTRITELWVRPLVLSVAISNASLVLSWPASAAGFHLESTSVLPATDSWTPVTEGLSTNNAVVSVSVPVAVRNEFYRLNQP